MANSRTYGKHGCISGFGVCHNSSLNMKNICQHLAPALQDEEGFVNPDFFWQDSILSSYPFWPRRWNVLSALIGHCALLGELQVVL